MAELLFYFSFIFLIATVDAITFDSAETSVDVGDYNEVTN